MANSFRDFVQPVKTIFERLQQQQTRGVIINGNDGSKNGKNVIPPYYPNLPEYPCELIRGTDGKVNEIRYGKDNRGYVWRQFLHRGADGRVDKITQENPDGSFDIVIHRGTDDKVKIVDIE